MTFHVKIMCSTEILINFDVNIPFLPYQNQNASYLCKKKQSKHITSHSYIDWIYGFYLMLYMY